MFRQLTDALTHPATLPVIGFVILVLLAFLTMSVVSPSTKPRTRQFSDNPLMNALGWIGAVLALPGLIILFAVGWELFVLAWNFPALDADPSVIRWHATIMLAMLAAIGAIFTLVFAFIRAFATERQTRATEEGLITDRISKAVDQLGSKNTAVRMGAIHSLERIMVDSEGDRVMVMRTLNAYLKYRQSRLPPEDPTYVPEVEVDMQAALDVILRWKSE
jgi:hypothetical protein